MRFYSIKIHHLENNDLVDLFTHCDQLKKLSLENMGGLTANFLNNINEYLPRLEYLNLRGLKHKQVFVEWVGWVDADEPIITNNLLKVIARQFENDIEIISPDGTIIKKSLLIDVEACLDDNDSKVEVEDVSTETHALACGESGQMTYFEELDVFKTRPCVNSKNGCLEELDGLKALEAHEQNCMYQKMN